MSLLRDKSKKQMEELNRQIKSAGGDIQDIVRRSEKTKENKMPNAYYMDNPFDSKRKSIDTWEHWSKNGAYNKSIAMKSRDPKNKPNNMYTKFENYNNKLNESSYTDFLTNYSDDIKESLKILRKISKNYELIEDVADEIDEKMQKYDENVSDQIDFWVGSGNFNVDDIAKFAIENQDRFGTEPQMVLDAIKEWGEVFDIDINESSDEDKYLTPKQKKLPEGLKKGIIARNKKAGKTVNDKDDDKDDKKKDDKDDKKKDDKDDKKCDKCDDKKKDDKKDDSSKSDEDKYLTPKQKKLPEGLKKGIIAKSKKKKEKVNESKKENITKKRKKDSEIATFDEPKKLNNLKHFHELTYDGKTTQKGDLNDDSWVKGTNDDKLRPMFKNLPNNEIRPNYDILRAGKNFTMEGKQGIIVGIKNGELLLDVVNDDNKHEVKKYDMKKVIKEMKKNKTEKIDEKFFDRFKKKTIDHSHYSKNSGEGDDINGNRRSYPKMMAPPREEKYPMIYAFMTKELEERLSKKKGPKAIMLDGYRFLCQTPEKLNSLRKKYKTGEKYNGETITSVSEMPESHLVH